MMNTFHITNNLNSNLIPISQQNPLGSGLSLSEKNLIFTLQRKTFFFKFNTFPYVNCNSLFFI